MRTAVFSGKIMVSKWIGDNYEACCKIADSLIRKEDLSDRIEPEDIVNGIAVETLGNGIESQKPIKLFREAAKKDLKNIKAKMSAQNFTDIMERDSESANDILIDNMLNERKATLPKDMVSRPLTERFQGLKRK